MVSLGRAAFTRSKLTSMAVTRKPSGVPRRQKRDTPSSSTAHSPSSRLNSSTPPSLILNPQQPLPSRPRRLYSARPKRCTTSRAIKNVAKSSRCSVWSIPRTTRPRFSSIERSSDLPNRPTADTNLSSCTQKLPSFAHHTWIMRHISARSVSKHRDPVGVGYSHRGRSRLATFCFVRRHSRTHLSATREVPVVLPSS